MAGRTACYAMSVISAVLMLIAGAIVHLMSWWNKSVDWEIFYKKESTVWDKYENVHHALRFYYTEWLFCLWVVMYVTQLAWTVYGIELICRRSRDKATRHHSVPVVPSVVYIMVAIAAAAILGWLFLWTSADSANFRYAPLCMLGATVCFYIALAVSVGSLSKYLPVLYGVSANKYIWEIRILVHNGLGIAASWTTVILFYSVVVALAENQLLPGPTVDGYIFLSLLGGYLIIWFVVDLSLAKKYVPHLLTPYAIFILAEIQVLMKSHMDFNYHFIYAAILLGVTCILALIRFSVAVGMSINKL